MPPKFKLAMTALAAVALTATPAGGVPTTIHLRAHVPVYCNVELYPALTPGDEEGVINLGTSQELCNSPNGYRIILQHPEDLVDAAVIRGGDRIPLSSSGETVLWNSDHPGFEMRQLALDLGEQTKSVNRLGLRIEVKH